MLLATEETGAAVGPESDCGAGLEMLAHSKGDQIHHFPRAHAELAPFKNWSIFQTKDQMGSSQFKLAQVRSEIGMVEWLMVEFFSRKLKGAKNQE